MKTPLSLQLAKKFFNSLRGEEVYFWEGPFAPINYAFGWNEKRFYSSFRTPPFSVFLAIRGRDAHVLFSNLSYLGYSREVFRDHWNRGNKTSQLGKGFQLLRQRVRRWYEQIVLLDFENLSEARTLNLIAEAKELYGKMFGYTLYVETFDEEIALSVIGNKNKKIIDKVWGKAAHPYFESFDNRRLRQAISLIERKNVDREKLFRYTDTDFFTCKPLSETRRKLSTIKRNLSSNKARLIQSLEKQGREYESYSKWLLTLSDQEKKLAEYIQQAMETRDQRKDPYAQLQTVQALLGQELLRRSGIDPSLAPYLVGSDLDHGLKTLLSKRDEFVKRPEGLAAYCDSAGRVISVTEEIIEVIGYIEKKHLEQEAGFGVEQIKGLIGCRGTARGKVCLIPDVTRAQHFRDGDVLVTGMTRPELVLYMRRASAIVTDEGGVTCHAAIVSRELQLPCVIGTKIATKILKNGDEVEVDAENGVVRILKKAAASR